MGTWGLWDSTCSGSVFYAKCHVCMYARVYKKAWWRPKGGYLMYPCAMMISTRNRDEKSGLPFVNGLGGKPKKITPT